MFYKKRHKIIKSKNVNKDFLGTLHLGIFGLKAKSSGVLTDKQVETVRRVVAQKTKRSGKIKIRIFFQQPLTKKPLLTRMGKGSGSINRWVSHIKGGNILLEVSNIQKALAIKALKVACLRLPFKTVIVYKEFF